MKGLVKMRDVNRYPTHLAEAVQKELGRRGVHSISRSLLDGLFESMYFASLKTEEREPLIFHIVYADPNNFDPNPPRRKRRDRWTFVKLKNPISFTVQNIQKIAKASDPRTSSFAVYHNKNNELSLWGLVDQGNRYHDYVNFEAKSAYERPGIFQASISGVGQLIAYIGTDKIAELRVNQLVRKASDVLRGGPILANLMIGIEAHVKAVKRHLSNRVMNEYRARNDVYLAQDFIIALCRLLLRIQNYRHGGAVLLTPDTKYRGLNIKYRLNYPRLRTALEANSVLDVEHSYLVFRGKNVANRWLEAGLIENELDDSKSELDGSIWFISLLSKVDGLILINKCLEVKGYGVEITTKTEPRTVYLSPTRGASVSSLRPIDYNHFGTRHRSMIRYCNLVPGSVGFVISQDGDVRAISSVQDRVIIWENIRLQLHDFVHGRGEKSKAD